MSLALIRTEPNLRPHDDFVLSSECIFLSHLSILRKQATKKKKKAGYNFVAGFVIVISHWLVADAFSSMF